MKKVMTVICMAAAMTAAAQKKPSGSPALYEAAVSFGSVCCGPPSSDFLKAFVKKFSKDNRAAIGCSIAGGCGREGEFVILFSLTGVKAATKTKFTAALKKLVTEQDAKNKAGSSSSGVMEVQLNVTPDAVANCRMGISKWE